ncbi:MAG TPA: efflux RND transporter periplasmic adaptor subunit [Candidatus Sulfotelmatobacter sp.]|nr:efflux RND transporter periplasmic adaptor subunit [Candidatus Sulfotelmatobacter sp.]
MPVRNRFAESEEEIADFSGSEERDVIVATTPGSRTRLVLTLTAILALSLVVPLRLSRHRNPSATASNASQPLTIIHTAQSRKGDMGAYIDALGTVTPVSTVNIFSQVTGQVIAVHYREGQLVQKGDPLIDIDPRPFRAQLQQAEGLLDHDRGVLKQAEIDLARYREAFAEHAVAQQILDDQEQAVVQDQGTVKFDEGQVQSATVQLSYCHITSPSAGRVGLRLIDVGNTAFAGGSNSLVVITELQPITVVFNVAEDHLGEVQTQLHQHAPLLLDAFDRNAEKRIARGTLLTLDNQIDTSTGTVRLRGEFNNRDLALFPNQFVNVRLLVRTLKDTVLIPSAAVQRNGTRAFVFVVNKNTVSVRNITEQSFDGNTTAVAGLQAGEWVAVSGFDKLQDGTQVTVEQERGPAVETTGATL